MVATVVSTPAQSLESRSPLTLWHLLSLDAPTVAALWTCFFAHNLRVAQSTAVPLALGLAVWLLYVGDRIRDGMRGGEMEERHRFHLEHRSGFLAAGVLAAGLLFIMLVVLPHALRVAWLLLALPLAIYVTAVHVLRPRHFPKEPLVGIFFGAAVTMPAIFSRAAPPATLLLSAIAFASLCWLNCIAIARWEQALLSTDRCTAWLGKHFTVAAFATMLLAAPLLLQTRTCGMALAVASGAVCLLKLDCNRRHRSRTTVRALADVALLTPLPIWMFSALLRSR